MATKSTATAASTTTGSTSSVSPSTAPSSTSVTTTTSSAPITTSAVPTTTSSVPTTTSAAPPTTTQDPAVLILTAEYPWGPSSSAESLQAVLGITPDGWYGNQTRAAHLTALAALGLSTAGVPVPPTTVATTTLGPTPTGRFHFERDHRKYGQGNSRVVNCSSWTVNAVNDSSATVVEFVFAPLSANLTSFDSGYLEEHGESPPDIPMETPAPVAIEVYITPGTSQEIEFETCSPTPVPSQSGIDYSFGVTPPRSVSFTWKTGHTGTTCYGWGCP